jgi:hypothetical protein
MFDQMRDTGPADAITIRRALPEDATPLLHLATLDDAEPLEGDVLVAEVGGELWAAHSLAHARTIADPFRPAEQARAMLKLRAAHINGIALRYARRRPTWRRQLTRYVRTSIGHIAR